MEMLKGIGVANGIAIGEALLILDEDLVTVEETVDSNVLEGEVRTFVDAISKAKSQIRSIKERVKDKIGEEHAFIFDTHILLLNDRTLKNETINFIRTHRCNAEWAFSQVLVNLLREFNSLEDPYFAERGNDLKDVGRRVLNILKGIKEFGFKNLKKDVIVVGSDFGPSNITHFDHPHILGFASDMGGQTTHTTIVAKALDLPAVVGLHDISKRVRTGDLIIIDSFSGKVFINPDKKTLGHFRSLMLLYEKEEAGYLKDIGEPALSRDGLRIELLANIELSHEVPGALAHGAEGIGLYRTEFLFLQCEPDLPTERVHYETYCQIARDLHGRTLTIRTLDLGGEKFFHRRFVRKKEVNPVMGLRGIRLCLKQPDIFRTQLRAILRAAHDYPNIQIMFPLISGVGEWRKALAFVESVRQELHEEGLSFAEFPKMGVMVEVPSAAMVADFLAREVSFFSIGTNDLLQYFLAIDRSNDDVSYLYSPFHPGFVRLLSTVIEAANRQGIEVSCCGETASSPIYACLLIQLGLRKLSMNPSSLPVIHHLIRAMDFGKLDQLVPMPLDQPLAALNRATYADALKHLLEAKDFKYLVGEIMGESC